MCRVRFRSRFYVKRVGSARALSDSGSGVLSIICRFIKADPYNMTSAALGFCCKAFFSRNIIVKVIHRDDSDEICCLNVLYVVELHITQHSLINGAYKKIRPEIKTHLIT